MQFNLDEMDNAECLAEFRFLVKCSDYQKGLYAIKVQFVTAS